LVGLRSLGVFRFGIYFSFANAFTWMIVVGTPMVLMAEHLGATAFQVGLLYSAVMLFVPVQLLATSFLPYLGYRRQVVATWSARTSLLIIPVAIALLRPEEAKPFALNIFIITIFVFCFIRSLGACAVLPWLYEIIPEDMRGRYFGTDSFVIGFAGVCMLLFSSALFAILPPYGAFGLLFTTAIFGAVASIVYISRLPNGSRPKILSLKQMFFRWVSLISRPSYYRIFLWLHFVYSLVGYGLAPFTVYYLKRSLDYSLSYIMFLSALQFIGMSCAALLLKNWIDRFGAKPFFIISHILTLAFIIYWSMLVLYPGWLEYLLPIAFFLLGMAVACYMTATNKYMPKVCRPSERALAIALYQSIIGVTAGGTATLWGYFLKDAETGEIVTVRFIIYLLCFILIQSYMIAAYRKLREKGLKADASKRVFAWNRPLRYIFNFVNLVDRPKR
ncbi:MAG: MFS transporter, partial [Verrucomicrobiota bacterium]